MPASLAPLSARSPGPTVALWLVVVYLAWCSAHGLNLVLGIVSPSSSLAARLAWWTSAKAVAWLLPTAALAWSAKRGSLRHWLGLCTLAGVGRAALVASLWLALQYAGARLHLPLVEAPPREPRWSDLPGALVIAPLFEELMFRGVMLRVLRDGGVRREAAVCFSALAFAGLHLPGWFVHRGLDQGIVGAFAGIAIFGFVLGYLAWHARSFWAVVALHVLHNAHATGLTSWFGMGPL